MKWRCNRYGTGCIVPVATDTDYYNGGFIEAPLEDDIKFSNACIVLVT